MKNFVENGNSIYAACTDPAVPKSGDPVRIGILTGIAATDESDGGNDSGNTTVEVRNSVCNLSVAAVDQSGNNPVAIGDALYYVDANTPKLSKTSTGYFFGIALGVITTGATATIPVLHLATPGVMASSLTGAQVATLATGSPVGGVPLVFMYDLAAGALADTDIVVTNKIRVIAAWLVLTGAGVASTTITVKNGATAITDAMAASGSVKTKVSAATFDAAQWQVAAGGTLRVTSATGATQPACTVFVEAVRVA